MRISMKRLAALAGAALLSGAAALHAEPRVETIGGDYYRAGSGSGDLLNAPRDVFAAGASITVRGRASGDVHVTGFDVDVETDAENVYAAGAAVAIRSTISEDLMATGGSVKTATSSTTGGNARLIGGTVTVNGSVEGALMAAGGEVIIDAPIAGDVRITAGRIAFGSAAKIGGTLIYSAPSEIDVPASVIAPDRVTFRPIALGEAFEDAAWDADEYSVLPGVLGVLAGFAVTLAFILVLAALFLAFAPEMVKARREAAITRPGLNLTVGVLALAVLFGLTPVAGMTIVGIPFIPIILLAIFLAWTLGYVLGAYVIGLRIWSGFGGEEPAMLGRLIVLACAVTSLALANFIPFIGWLANFAVVLFGIGAIATGALERLLASRGMGAPRSAVPADHQ